MSLNKNNIILFFIFNSLVYSHSQEETIARQDSTHIETLDEVVISGQINPQSVDKSVFEVTVINKRDIALRAGNNLADLLNQTLNLNIDYQPGNSKSTVNLFGLDGQYFKILIDNIPVINEEGFGNNVDLTLINVDDIERVEIVEGSMGVQYGANAISGIINIITKKSSRKKTTVSVYAQEETVGDEYELYDQGRHIQSFDIGHNFSDNVYASIGYLRNDFAGFWNGRQGEVYDGTDGLRGHSWLPKEQNNAKAKLKYSNNKGFEAFYTFDYFNERIDRFGSDVSENENTSTNTTNPSAIDQIFRNNRFIHNVNTRGRLNHSITYDVSISYQEQDKDLERYTYFIRPEIRDNVLKEEYSTRSVIFSRGTLNNLFKRKKFNMQVGYEVTNFKGKGSPFFGSDEFFGADIFNNENVTNRLTNYDGFASAELLVSDQWSLKPGVRLSYSNLFSPQYMVSLSSFLKLKKNYELRTIVGSSNRTPSYQELFLNFVDINHNFTGNPNLNPEQGFSIFTHLKKTFELKNDAQLSSKLSASYLDVKDRIDFVIINTNPLASQYQNIDKFKSIGLFLTNTYRQGYMKAQLGVSLQGVSQILDSTVDSRDDFLYNFQFNSNLSYTLPKWNSSFAVYYKFLGPQPRFVLKENSEGNQTYERGQTDALSWLDASFRKRFANDAFEVTLGARNLLDINTVNTTAVDGGAHGDAPTAINLAYGRSFFLRLNYSLDL